MLQTQLSQLKVVSEKKALLLNKLNLYTLEQMINFLPRSYKDFSSITPIIALKEGEACVQVRITGQAKIVRLKNKRTIVKVSAHDGTGSVDFVWFNQPYLQSKIVEDAIYLVYGKVSMQGKKITFENPEIERASESETGVAFPRGILPVYSLTAGITQKTMRKIVKECITIAVPFLKETIPQKIKDQFALCGKNYAYENIHFPEHMLALEESKRRIAIEDLIFLLLTVELMAQKNKNIAGIKFNTNKTQTEFLEKLPFEATEAQKNVINEICNDMGKSKAMNRLVQGDVGSGKTVIGLYALYVAAKNNYQGIFMAPTEIVARQHFENAQKLFGDKIRCQLLTGGLTIKKRQEIYDNIQQNKCDIIIGTHAIIQQGVKFANLGIVVTDEQHRFGVKQRALVGAKGEHPDVIIMSATPIPRTLSLIIYGDLEVSIVGAMPHGRKAIKTFWTPQNKIEDMLKFVYNEALENRQTYIVCPLVEQSEMIEAKSAIEIFEMLKKTKLNEIGIELLHGAMKSKEKTEIIEKFKSGEVKVLVSTTVIEVGVDVSQATNMIVYGAERFGLAQLHQIRGRVGRGAQQSYCFLISDSRTKNAKERLEFLCKNTDGFKIAQKDLEMRGPGEFLGTRQSGEGDFKTVDALNDIVLFEKTQKVVKKILESDEFEQCREIMICEARRRYAIRYKNIAMN